MDSLEMEESCLRNKQSISEPASSSSEVSNQLSGMTPAAFTPERNSSSSLRRRSGPVRRAKGDWKPHEDEELKRAVNLYKRKNWKKIAEFLPGRTEVQCLHRWQKVLNPDLVKGPWNQEEDDMLTKLVDMHGPIKWSTISNSLPGRIGKQCRERWYNHLKPEIKRDAWTSEEERVIIEAHMELGNKWTEIANRLPGRTDNSIKNYWHSSLKKKAKFCWKTDMNAKRCTPCAVSSQLIETSKFEEKKECLELMASQRIALRESHFSGDHESQTFDRDLVHEESDSPLKSEANIFTREIHQNEEPWRSTQKCQKSDPDDYDSKCLKSPQIEGLGVPSSSMLSHFNSRILSSPIGHLTRSTSAESILRSAARNFTNIPSIIRRREVQAPLVPDSFSSNNSRIQDSCISNENRADSIIKGYQNRFKRGEILKSVEKKLDFEMKDTNFDGSSNLLSLDASELRGREAE